MLQFLMLLFLLCYSAMFIPAHANSWLELIAQKVDQVQKILNQDQKKPQPAQAQKLPDNLPSHWQYSYYNEPILNSQMVVLETGKQHQQSVLLVHGLGTLAMKDWFSIIPELEKKYHVIAIDLPGFGLSGNPQGRFSPSNYARILNFISFKYAKGRVITIGHSMGGAVALRFAAMYPNKVAKLILVDAAGILEKTAFIKHVAQLPINEGRLPGIIRQKLAQLNSFASSVVESSTIHDPIYGVFNNSDMLWHKLLGDYPNINAAFSLVDEDFNQAIRQLKVPTDIIWGKQDKIATFRTAQVLYHQLSNATLQVIDDAEHVPMSSHTAVFLRLLKNSLQDKLPREKTVPSPIKKQPSLICDNQSNKTYSGHYQTITLTQCTNIKLIDITSNNIIINDSLVAFENLTLTGNTTVLTLNNSVVKVTNGLISGDQAIYINDSRLDLAGVEINAKTAGIYAATSSKIVLSLSQLNSQSYQGGIHGAYQLEQQALESLLLKLP